MKLNNILKETKKGTYVGVKFSQDDEEIIVSIIEKIGVPNPIAREDIHSTLLYSRKYLANYKVPSETDMYVYPKEFHIFNGQDGKDILVIKLDSLDLSKRHEELMKEHNATYDFPEYIPHITLSYDIEGFMTLPEIKKKFSDLLPEKFHIVSEYVEDLDLEWKY